MNDKINKACNGPLEGLRVLDMGSFLAGPYGATLMGDMGADVIKIESYYGDESRHQGVKRGDETGPYLALNRSKRDMVLNLQKAEARAVFASILATTDILITNVREPGLSELGMSYEQVKAHKPDIIWIWVTGFGPDGPYASRPGIDFLAQGYTGVLPFNGDPSGGPVRLGLPAVDVMASLMVVNAALTALLVRNKTGEGQRIDISLLDTLMHAQATSIGVYLANGEPPKRTGNRSQYFAPSGIYPTRDDKQVVITTPGEKFFPNICRALDMDWDTDPRFSGIDGRMKNQDELDRVIAERTRQFDREELLEKLIDQGVLTAPVNSYEEVVKDPQILHNKMIVPVEHPEIGTVKVTGVPIRFSGTPASVKKHPPMQGEHTREILAELGYDTAETDALMAKGAVADRPEMLRLKAARRAAKKQPA